MQAVSSPLLETSMEGARSILLSITGGAQPVAVGGQRGRQVGLRGRAPRREHHLRRDGRREARRPGLGDGRRHRLRRRGPAQERAAPAGAGRRAGARCSVPRASAPRAWPDWTRAAAGSSVDELDVPEFTARAPEPTRRWHARSARAPLCYRCSTWPHAEKGVIAAGHPLTAQAGARVLREGGNASTRPSRRCSPRSSAEPLLTGPGAGGYMLVAGAGRGAGAARLLRRGARRARGTAARPSWPGVDVSFGDADQVFHIGPASCGVYGTPAGVCEAAARWGTRAARASSPRPPRGSRARACR